MANSQCFVYQCNTKFDSNVSMTYCHILLQVLLQKLDRLRFCCRTLPVVEEVQIPADPLSLGACSFGWCTCSVVLSVECRQALKDLILVMQ